MSVPLSLWICESWIYLCSKSRMSFCCCLFSHRNKLSLQIHSNRMTVMEDCDANDEIRHILAYWLIDIMIDGKQFTIQFTMQCCLITWNKVVELNLWLDWFSFHLFRIYQWKRNESLVKKKYICCIQIQHFSHFTFDRFLSTLSLQTLPSFFSDL